MFPSLAAAIAHNTIIAGTDFAWVARGTSRPRSDAMRGLRAYLWTAQNGTCPSCGDDVSLTEGEVAHVVGNGGGPTDKMRGYSAGNLYFAHISCNLDDFEVFGDIVPAHGFARPELIALDLPGHSELVSWGRNNEDADALAQARVREVNMAARIARRDAHMAALHAAVDAMTLP